MKKMKKYYFLAAGLLLMLGSCSQDDIVEANLGADEIRFAAVTNGSTRAADIYNPKEMPASFQVSAMSQNKVYISDDKIVRVGEQAPYKWENSTGTRYWPEDAVDFYAHVNAGTTFALNNGAPKFNNFTVASAVGSQVDLLYAVKKGETKETTPVQLNFRHALSQIVFKARNESENIFVQIKGVKVMNVKNSGTYTFPTTTDSNLPTSGTANSENRGSWDLADTKADYNVTFSLTDVKGSKTNPTAVNLTDEKGTALMLMPQTTYAWVPETYPKPGVAENTNSYLLVDCVIYNVADGSATTLPGDNVCLWGEESEGKYTTKELAIPVKFAWEEGKKYTYTLVFGNGNGGYNPDPDGPDPDPEPVLVPISFEVTVDEFLDGGNYDVESPNEPGQ